MKYINYLLPLIILLISCESTKKLKEIKVNDTIEYFPVFENVILLNVSGLRKDKLSWYGYKNTTPQISKYMGEADVFNNHFSVSYIPYRSKQALLLSEYPELINPFKNPGKTLSKEEVLRLKFEGSLVSRFGSEGYFVFPSNQKDWISSFNINSLRDVDIIKSDLKKFKKPFFLNLSSSILLTPNYFPPQKFMVDENQLPYSGKIPKSIEDFEAAFNRCKKNVKKCSNQLKNYPLADYADSGEFKYRFFHALVDINKKEDIVFLNSLYDKSIMYLDFLIGELLKQLDSNGFLENTLIVLTADTGSSLFDVHPLSVGGSLVQYSGQYYFLNEVITIPLIFGHKNKKKFYFQDKIKSSLTNSTDIAPTLLEFLGLKVPKSMQGYNLLKTSAIRTTTYGASKTQHKGLEKFSTNGDFIYISSESRGELLIDNKSKKSYIRSEFFKFQNIVEKLRLGIGVK